MVSGGWRPTSIGNQNNANIICLTHIVTNLTTLDYFRHTDMKTQLYGNNPKFPDLKKETPHVVAKIELQLCQNVYRIINKSEDNIVTYHILFFIYNISISNKKSFTSKQILCFIKDF